MTIIVLVPVMFLTPSTVTWIIDVPCTVQITGSKCDIKLVDDSQSKPVYGFFRICVLQKDLELNRFCELCHNTFDHRNTFVILRSSTVWVLHVLNPEVYFQEHFDNTLATYRSRIRSS